MTKPNPSPYSDNRKPLESFQVVLAIIGLIAVAATLTLRTVEHPGRLELTSPNPTPLGYTWSLLLFVLPLSALVWWFFRHMECRLPRKAFWRTILVLVPLGFILDLLFGHMFFLFPNPGATLGLAIPAVGGAIPIEEFIFYLTGFMLILLTYIWADEYWMRAYNVPDYSAAARGMPRLVQFHPASVVLGLSLWVVAVLYKKTLAPSPEGFPWYFTYLLAVGIIPAAGFFPTVQRFINWRAFGFTFFFILLISLLWEVTLGVPYGWWDYEAQAMMGLRIGAWWQLPIEAVCVWVSITFTTVIVYEVIKIWQALGTRALEAFLGMKTETGIDSASN